MIGMLTTNRCGERAVRTDSGSLIPIEAGEALHIPAHWQDGKPVTGSAWTAANGKPVCGMLTPVPHKHGAWQE